VTTIAAFGGTAAKPYSAQSANSVVVGCVAAMRMGRFSFRIDPDRLGHRSKISRSMLRPTSLRADFRRPNLRCEE